MAKLLLTKCALIVAGIGATLMAILVLRTTLYFSIPQELINCENIDEHKPITDERHVVDRFIQALRFKTITKAPQDYDSHQIQLFIEFLNRSFPLVHSSNLVELKIINERSLLYHISGSDKSLKPYLLLGHLDVVPAQEDKWDVSPFGGIVKDGYIYGRGTVDLKDVVMGLLESLEFLLENRFSFQRSLYIAIGHDEEGRGLDGAKQTSHYLRSIGINEFEYILDEGPFILNGVILGTDRSVAMIGVTEKGFMNVKLTAKGAVGHSSVPPMETSIVSLSKKLSKFGGHTHPNYFGRGLEKDMIEALAPYCSLVYKVLFSNLWLFGPFVSKLLENHLVMNSYVRTTTAVTMFKSGVKDNILPDEASATINHRIYPLSSVSETLEYDREVVDDERISVEVLGVPIEPHPISPYGDKSFGFQTIKKSIRQVFPHVVVIPGVMTAATDTRWFLNFTQNIYRFSPAYISMADLPRIHGHNERISIDNYMKLVNFYHHVIIASNERCLSPQKLKDEL
ncbi:unnamed protein product [Medioppia subpectinata]|uniref:Peptidase M20 dimerisation domain-containing protein n=1 Tax=Medioppia subpectinata TaxID=1979941 RepID=A0A7R9PTZ5_9ACAR|nr:unnamed protein product [Medioppia subpectinata]CAG2101190.1 unnamed protein product [Medioppia subpectinata]